MDGLKGDRKVVETEKAKIQSQGSKGRAEPWVGLALIGTAKVLSFL